jgi:hypothetical protein
MVDTCTRPPALYGTGPPAPPPRPPAAGAAAYAGFGGAPPVKRHTVQHADWCVDSGSAKDMAWDRRIFRNYRPVQVPTLISFGGGRGHASCRHGGGGSAHHPRGGHADRRVARA